MPDRVKKKLVELLCECVSQNMKPQICGNEITIDIAQGKIADHLIANGVTVQEGKPIEAFLHPIDTYKGLKAKYLVFKADTGGKVDNCFVLCPDKDPVAVEALRAYARNTDNETLAEDIYKWVGKGEQVQEWISVKPDGVHDLSPHNFKKVQRLKNVTAEILQCKVCGKVSIGWYRQNNTEEIEQWPAD